MIDVKLHDFSGEIEWFKLGTFLIIDNNYRAVDDLIHLALPEIEALASIVHKGYIDENEQVPMLKSLLREMQHKYEQLYISDINGNYFNADGQKNNIIDRSYFHLVMKGKTVISEPIINKSTNRPCIAVATPVWNKRKVVGLFGATITLDSMYGGLRFLSFKGKRKQISQRKKTKSTHRQASLKNLAKREASG
jgi:hypothetical protein